MPGDDANLATILTQLNAAATVTTAAEVDALNDHLEAVAQGDALVLQADCGYPLGQASARLTSSDVDTLWNMAMVLMAATGISLAVVGRLGGQCPTPGPVAQQTLTRYAHATATRNLIRTLRDARHTAAPAEWHQPLASLARRRRQLGALTAEIQRNVAFLLAYQANATLPTAKTYAGHRLTTLDYDTALVRAER